MKEGVLVHDNRDHGLRGCQIHRALAQIADRIDELLDIELLIRADPRALSWQTAPPYQDQQMPWRQGSCAHHTNPVAWSAAMLRSRAGSAGTAPCGRPHCHRDR